MALSVIKVGGSLLTWPELPGRLHWLRGEKRDERLVFVAGGGASADVIRALDQIHGLGERSAHMLALHALDLTAEILARLMHGLPVVDRLDDRECWPEVVVLAPRRPLEADEQARPGEALAHSWNVTSDSIAARLALRLGASGLLLLKSAPIPTGADLETASRLGLVDPAFAEEARRLPLVQYLNLRDPEAPFETLSGLRSH